MAFSRCSFFWAKVFSRCCSSSCIAAFCTSSRTLSLSSSAFSSELVPLAMILSLRMSMMPCSVRSMSPCADTIFCRSFCISSLPRVKAWSPDMPLSLRWKLSCIPASVSAIPGETSSLS